MAYEATEKDAATKAPEGNKKDKLDKIKRCFKHAYESEERQRERELEDLAFQVAENQWDANAVRLRKGDEKTPGRPMLSVSLLNQPLNLIRNQADNAHLGVEVNPVSEDADKDVAQVKQDLYRRIERDSNAHDARMWALDRAVQCGRGFYRINTQWDEDGDDPFDQEISIERILYQDLVFMDPGARRSDLSDAEWGMICTWVPIDSFKEQFPDADIPNSEHEFEAWAKQEPQWVTGADEKKAVLVAEYFYKEHNRKKITKAGRTREMDEVSVYLCKATAREILEESQWNGRKIPIIRVLGKELQPFDDDHRFEGIVRGARDGQKAFNYAISSTVEAVALEPKAPFVGAEGQFEGHPEWYEANFRNLAFLEYKAVTHDGQLVPPPMRAQVDGSRMLLSSQLAEMSKELVQTSTAVFSPSLGEMPRERTAQSGRAIQALQSQADAGTSNFIQDMAKISMRYEAEVVMDMMPLVYDRPGRVTQVLGAEEEARIVMLNAPYVQGPDGRPQRIPPNQPPPQNVKAYDLSKGKYSVSVSVGKSYQTRLQEGSDQVGEIMTRNPALVPLVGATYFRFQDWPGSQELAKVLKKVRDKQVGPIDDDQEGSPEQIKSQLDAAKGQMQQMQQVIQQLGKELETEKAKQEATLQKANMDNQTALQKTDMDNATKRSIAELQAQMDLIIAQMRAQAEQEKLRLQGQMMEREAQIKENESRREMVREDVQAEREEAREDRTAERDSLEADKQRRHEMDVTVVGSALKQTERPKKG